VGRLPNPRFIHIEREDLLGQALSLVRARQSGRYVSWDAAAAEARYDRREIARALHGIAAGQARWRAYFARNGIMPLPLTYEQVATAPEGTVCAVARHIGLEEEVAVDVGRVRSTVLRDGLSEEWRARFLAEAADLDKLDDPALGGWLPLLRRLRAGLSFRAPDRRSWAFEDQGLV
jgi:LPS sulfotransferase NodH